MQRWFGGSNNGIGADVGVNGSSTKHPCQQGSKNLEPHNDLPLISPDGLATECVLVDEYS